MMSFVILQECHADQPFTADIFNPHLPGAVELRRFWKSGLENVARGPPKIIQRPIGRKMPRKLTSGSQQSLRK
jgi:hypothetical protein